MKKVYIVVEGGCVQAVYADDSKAKVILIDMDNFKVAEDSERTAIEISQLTLDAYINNGIVKQIF